ncbi:MAG: hypothetical protein DRJ01_16640 [Bacteroidetes bacterium]|nr:MAG: hypothetical protein DRJ01_16640 [Bacteroidota bacterium]
MRTIFILAMTLLTIVSCTSYKEFVSVQNKNNIPDGTQAIILTSDIETVKQAFKNKGIMLSSIEGGFKTEEILLDEGTRAMYKAHTFDNQIKITAFWGITQKVKSNIVVWAGADAASAYDVRAWDKVIYERDMKRPKRVFDFAVQIIEESNLKFSFR